MPIRSSRPQALALALAIGIGGACGPSLAAPPAPGTEDHKLLAPHSEWIQGLRRGGMGCCDMSDGRAVEARATVSGWEVRWRPGQLAGTPAGWTKVPEEAILRVPNPVGAPVAFWHLGQILCFVPPSMQ